MTKKTFHVIIEQDEDGGYVGKVPELQGCITQGDTLDELIKNIKEAIELCLEVKEEATNSTNILTAGRLLSQYIPTKILKELY